MQASLLLSRSTRLVSFCHPIATRVPRLSNAPPERPFSAQTSGPKSKSNFGLFAALAVGGVSLGAFAYLKRDDIFGTSEGGAGRKSHIYVPETAQYLIIGSGAAAFAAFRSIRTNDSKARILIVTDEPYKPYMRPPLSKELWYDPSVRNGIETKLTYKQWNGRERSIFFEHDDFYVSPDKLRESETGGVAVIHGLKATKVDAQKQKVTFENGAVISYDKCLVATGSKPKKHPIISNNPDIQSKVTHFRGIDDYKRIVQIARTAKNIVIVGGGFLGSELASALKHFSPNLNVHQVFQESGNVAKVLPEYLSKWTTEKIRKEGVVVHPNSTITHAVSKGRQVELTKSGSNEKLLADHVIVAVGAEPNSELAAASQLEMFDSGILVNAELEARTNVWVAGDVCSFYDVKLGRRRVEHHDHAVQSGRVAGTNMTGGQKPYTHQSMLWSDLGPDVGFEAIGIVDSTLQTVAVFAKPDETGSEKVTETEPSPSKPDYNRGVVFYLRDNIVVGVLLWNLFNRMPLARKIVNEHKRYDDLGELAKLFDLYAKEEDEKE